jgi:hypothetical protein
VTIRRANGQLVYYAGRWQRAPAAAENPETE